MCLHPYRQVLLNLTQNPKMKENFHITGLFYEKNGYKFRKVLNIKKNESKLKIPDLMVVMMNPGKSRPINGIDNSEEELEAVPDTTQSKIMEVMLNCGFEYSRILNLSDARETSSGKFYQLIPLFDNENIAHSIFDERRKNDFDKYFIKGVKTILAWGVDNSLTELAKNAITRIGNENCFGIKKVGKEYAYYHPLPPNYYKQKEWVEKVVEQIKTV